MRINEIKNLVVKTERQVQGIADDLATALQAASALRGVLGVLDGKSEELMQVVEEKTRRAKTSAHELAN